MSSSHNQTKATMEAHQLPSECYPPTDSDDESFVVLANDAEESSPMTESKLPLLQSGIIDESLEQATEAIMQSLTLQSLPTVPQMDASCAARSIDSSATNDEMQHKIELLIEENRKLSESLTQNNIVMKNQCETLLKWQEDVDRVHESHRKKFAETKDIIKQLQVENIKLKHLIRTVSTPPKQEDNSIIMKEVADLKDELQKANELSTKHVEEISSLKDSLKTVTDEKAQLEKDRDDLNAKLLTLTSIHSMQSVELFNMKSDLDSTKENNSMEMISLREELQKDSSLLAQQEKEFKRLNDEITGMKDAVILLKEQNLKLINNEGDLQKQVAAKDEEIENLKKEKMIVESNFDALQKEVLQEKGRLFDKISEVDKLKEEMCQLNQEIDVLHAEIEQNQVTSTEYALLKEKASDLSKQIGHNDLTTKQLEAAIAEAANKEHKLLDEITVLKCRLLKVRSSEANEETQQLKTQLQVAQSQIVDLKEAKKVVEKEAERNRSLVDELALKMKNSGTDQDKIVALEQQMRLYRADYETELNMKIRAIEELNKVAHDLSTVQKRNHELIEEIETMRRVRDEFVEVPRPTTAGRTPTPPLTQFSCPLCSSKFRSLRAVEEHVEMCINNIP